MKDTKLRVPADLFHVGRNLLVSKGALLSNPFYDFIRSPSHCFISRVTLGFFTRFHLSYLTLGRRDDAEKCFREAIKVSGDSYGEADIGLGTTMLDKGDFAGGEKTIRHGIELSPDSWLGHYELGRALLNENRIDEAETAALLSRSLAPSAAIIYRLLSNMYLRQKNYAALLEDLEAYLKLDPDSPASIRAKQLREQVLQEIASRKLKFAADSRL